MTVIHLNPIYLLDYKLDPYTNSSVSVFNSFIALRVNVNDTADNTSRSNI